MVWLLWVWVRICAPAFIESYILSNFAAGFFESRGLNHKSKIINPKI
jgi:hypothetical protein